MVFPEEARVADLVVVEAEAGRLFSDKKEISFIFSFKKISKKNLLFLLLILSYA